MDGEQKVVGRLRFRVCSPCRTGQILDIWVSEARQRQGLGREALCCLLTRCPNYRWTTTTQSRPGRAFLLAMTQETTTDLPPGGPLCSHLRGWPSRLWHHMMRRSASL
ncbi:GNAT family N-acetyltransferase [Streptomyces sp. NBC_00989]|uniref:GNAT family N-acetyltransferase n=1 Tax=Streptomyces sp. NBC_00989 TaxID=2903705 RepID=UPI00386B5574